MQSKSNFGERDASPESKVKYVSSLTAKTGGGMLVLDQSGLISLHSGHTTLFLPRNRECRTRSTRIMNSLSRGSITHHQLAHYRTFPTLKCFKSCHAGTAPQGVVAWQLLKMGLLDCFITEVAQQCVLGSCRSRTDVEATTEVPF